MQDSLVTFGRQKWGDSSMQSLSLFFLRRRILICTSFQILSSSVISSYRCQTPLGRKQNGRPLGLNYSTLSKQCSITIPGGLWVTIGLFNFLHHGEVFPGHPIIYLPSIRQVVMNISAFICNEIRHSQEFCSHNRERDKAWWGGKEQAFFLFYTLGFISWSLA